MELKSQQPEQRTLIVCGMHRSHTSFLASWLHACGLPMGDRLIPPELGNPSGFYEDLDFVDLHERVLKENNSSALLPGTTALRITPELQSQARSLVDAKCASHAQWGWKDPRTCLVYKSLWDGLIHHARIIVIYRHYSEVVNSCYLREIQLAHRAWATTHRKFKSKHPLAQPIVNLNIKIDRLRKHFKPPFSKSEILTTWGVYNNHCLGLADLIPKEHILFIRAQDLIDFQNEIFSTISNEWAFDLKVANANTLWNKGATTIDRQSGNIDNSSSEAILASLDKLNSFI